MKKNPKPSSYDFFKGKEYLKKNMTPKEKLKKSWKWVKIFIYTLLFAITLTGCIQSLALRSSSSVGSGVEFYNSQQQVSPSSTTVVQTEEKIEVVRDQRSAINGSDEVDHKEIEALREYTKKRGGEYGVYGTSSSLIILTPNVEDWASRKIDVVNDPVNPEWKKLFYHSTFKTYAQVAQWTALKVPTFDFNIKAFEEGSDAIKQGFKDSAAGKNSVYTIAPKLGPSADPKLAADPKTGFTANKQAVYSRDVIQVLYENTIALPEFKNNNALAKALEEVNTKGYGASLEDLKLVKKFKDTLEPFLKATSFTFEGKNYELEYNYLDQNPISFVGEASKPLITWGEYWELGPFYGLVIFPVSKLMVSIVYALPNLGGWETIISIALAIIISRLLIFVIGFKGLFMQSRQEELSLKKAKIDAKYAPYKGNKAMDQRKQQEISAMYKKNNFNPLSSLGRIFLTTPMFLAMWKIVQGVAVIKSTTWLGINFSLTSWQEIFYNQQWVYLGPILFSISLQTLASFLPKILNRKKRSRLLNENDVAAMKKTQKVQNMMQVFFMFIYVLWQAGIQIYSIFGAIWTIGETLGLHYYRKSNHFRTKLRPWLFKEVKK
ncbi:YidC/Oxa1 family membrane protein insertase [Candidatus Mycoplasma pogonae]